MTDSLTPAVGFEGVSKSFENRAVLGRSCNCSGRGTVLHWTQCTGKTVTLKLMIGLMAPYRRIYPHSR